MAEEVDFLTVADVMGLHAIQVEKYGGSAGILSPELLESALAMPAQGFGGEYLHDGLPAMAAAYLFHLCKNHPFEDGNKRVALFAAHAFLELNDLELDVDPDEAADVTIAVAAGEMGKDELTAWFRAHVRALADDEV